MKNLWKLFSIALLSLLFFTACEKEEEDTTFTLVGKWGMISGTITESDGSVNRYPELGKNEYYQYLEFRADGSLVKTTMPDKKVYYGTYSYNDATRDLSYKYDGDKYYLMGSINIISAKEMILTTDYLSSGRITQHFVKK